MNEYKGDEDSRHSRLPNDPNDNGAIRPETAIDPEGRKSNEEKIDEDENIDNENNINMLKGLNNDLIDSESKERRAKDEYKENKDIEGIEYGMVEKDE